MAMAPPAESTSPSSAAPRRAYTLGERITRNPVVLKELRGRMRGVRAFVLLTFHLLVMSVFVVLLLLTYQASSNYAYNTLTAQMLGKYLFGGLVGIELLLASFITPAVTASAISGERERQTLDLLRTTLLPPHSLVLGKLTAALVFVLLLLVAGLPLQSLSFLLGGVAPEEIMIASVLLIATAFLYGAAGIFFSTLMRRTLGATVLTYAFALLTLLGLPMVLIPTVLLGPAWSASRLMVQVVVYYGLGALVVTNPLATALVTETVLTNEHTTFFFTHTLYSPSGRSLTIPLVSPWLPYLLFCFWLGGAMVLLSMWLVRRVER